MSLALSAPYSSTFQGRSLSPDLQMGKLRIYPNSREVAEPGAETQALLASLSTQQCLPANEERSVSGCRWPEGSEV